MSDSRRKLMFGGEGVDFVDLGLSVLWAKGNICKTNNGSYYIGLPSEYGCYFSWANTEGHNANENYTFDLATYNTTEGANLGSNDISSTDSLHDPAYAHDLGYLPKLSDFLELVDNTDNEWTSDFDGTGVSGYKFMKKTDHSVFVFFPCAGVDRDTGLDSLNVNGYYWSSTARSANYAYRFGIASSTINAKTNSRHFLGFSVRPICPNPNLILSLSQDTKNVEPTSGSGQTLTVYLNENILKNTEVSVSKTGQISSATYSSSTGNITYAYSSNTDYDNSKTGTITVSYKNLSTTFTLTLAADYTYDVPNQYYDTNGKRLLITSNGTWYNITTNDLYNNYYGYHNTNDWSLYASDTKLYDAMYLVKYTYCTEVRRKSNDSIVSRKDYTYGSWSNYNTLTENIDLLLFRNESDYELYILLGQVGFADGGLGVSICRIKCPSMSRNGNYMEYTGSISPRNGGSGSSNSNMWEDMYFLNNTDYDHSLYYANFNYTVRFNIYTSEYTITVNSITW